MHFLFLPYGTPGDVYPYVGIGVGLKKRGHRVTFITHTHFRDLLALGLEHADLDDLDRHRATFHRITGTPNAASIWASDSCWTTACESNTHVERLYVPANRGRRHTLSYGACWRPRNSACRSSTRLSARFSCRAFRDRGSADSRLGSQAAGGSLHACGRRLVHRVFVSRPRRHRPENEPVSQKSASLVQRFLKRFLESLKYAVGLYPRWLAEPIPTTGRPCSLGFRSSRRAGRAVPLDMAHFSTPAAAIAFSPVRRRLASNTFSRPPCSPVEQLTARPADDPLPRATAARPPPTVKYVPFARIHWCCPLRAIVSRTAGSGPSPRAYARHCGLHAAQLR